MNEVTSTGLSPWKKPRSVVLSKSKAIKRKSKSFSVELTCNEDDDRQTHSILSSNPLSTIIENRNIPTNIFSVSRNTANNKTENDDDMRHFFKGSKPETCFNTCENENEISEEALNRTALFLSKFQTPTEIPEKLIEKTPLFKTDVIPIDWSLKTRLRFCSRMQFKCCNNVKSIHESQANLNFSKLSDFHETLEQSQTRNDPEDFYKTLFCESVIYWMFPFLPWLKLYPRSLNLNIANGAALPVEAQKSLLNNWTVSFKSLYNSLKCNECPYFYLIANSFMVLFRAENISGISDIHAIVTPTTKGVRKTLKEEGISFTMPLAERSSTVHFELSPEKDTTESCKENVNTNDEVGNANVADSECKKLDDCDEDCETNEWLEKIGLTSNVRVQSTRTALRHENFDSVDNKPQSTLLIQGGDVQALFNFLLNSKILISSTGPMTGIPPTLLSYQSFIGATMQKMKIQQAVVKNLSSTGESVTQHTLDITGPILPIHSHRLCKLFEKSQNGAFEMTGNTLDNSASFNCTTPESAEIIKYNGHNLDLSEKKSMEKQIGLKGSSTSINSIILEDELFKCY